MSLKFAERPNLFPWPPVILAISVIVAVIAQRFYALELPLFGGTAAGWLLGLGLMGAGIGLDLAAIITMRRAQTNILPHRPADKLLTHGVFNFSRNPIYLGNTLLVLGAAGVFQNGWFAVVALLAAIAVHFLAIKREEQHLALKFGPSWDDYARRTPRWVVF